MRYIVCFALMISANVDAQTVTFKSLNGPKLPDQSYPTSLSRMIVAVNGSVFTCGTGGLFRSNDQGASWTRISPYSTGGMELSRTDSTLYIAGAMGCYASLNQGTTWKPLNDQLPSTSLYSLTVDSKGNLFVTTRNQVFRSRDKGATWERIAANITPSQGYAWYIHTTPTDALLLDASYEFHRSTNAGDTWQSVPQAPHYQFIAISPTLLVGGGYSDGEILRSTTDGRSWQSVQTGYTDDFIDAIAMDNSGHLYAGSNYFGGAGHLFRSKDNGLSWSRDPTSDPDFECMAFAPNNYLFLGTHNYGAFRSLQYVSSVSSAIVAVGQEMSVYPNPGISHFSLSYWLASPCRVTIHLIDEAGRVVWQYQSQEAQTPGEQEMTLDAQSLLPGVYAARLVAGDKVAMTKLVVAR